VGIKEVVVNLRATNAALQKQLTDCKRQNAKMREALLHGPECWICRPSQTCPDRERLFRVAFSRQLLNLRNP